MIITKFHANSHKGYIYNNIYSHIYPGALPDVYGFVTEGVRKRTILSNQLRQTLVSKPKIVKTFQVTFNVERIPGRPLFTVAPAFQVIETGSLRIGEIYPVRGHRMNQQDLLAV